NVTIGAPLAIPTGDGLDDFDPIGPFGGPFVPADKTYTLTNLAAFALDWIVTVDQSWLTVDGSDTSDGQLDAGDSVAVSVALSDETLGMSGGEYTGLITFTELHTGFEQTRNVTLNINQGLAVTPLDTYFAYASLQDGMVGEVIPHQFVYQLTNLDAESITYDVLDYPSWILVDGLPDEQELGAGESVAMFVTIDPTAAAALGEDNPVDTITILNSSSGVGDTTRTVSLTLVEPVFDSPTTVAVSGLEDPQPNGPTYRFEIGVTEVTNEQFAVFLNDARDNPDNERGAFMYHDTDSGDVYINDAESGESGETGSDDLITKMFDSSTSAWITFVDDSYVVDPDFEDHPAVGMTWYGAVKYCNWLTIDQGFPPAHRCYLESTFDDLTGWRPATISADDWADGDLNDAERLVLVTDYAGYRLPMDDGANNPDPLTDAADDYNEWYKAAAWNTEADQNTLYGFGRDVITGADANYIASGDPFDDATTPVAYYDGSNQGGSFQTNDTDNSFGLHDMSGNVLEMLQGRHNPPGLLVTTRSTSYIQGSQQVSARSGTFAGSPSPTVGFRVLRAPVPLLGDGDGDGDIDLLDMGAFQICFTGPDEPFADPTCSIFDFDADTDIDLVDFAQMQDVITGP
ncbi:MAG: SUMF1/EgtB/PvdO family nonheme iron enzyme, partial [Planctomycetes bacterium]|nr:SUMF1/EgtB/PvdO family nonheme iron enzyme [Planctomycetota bacterium]